MGLEQRRIGAMLEVRASNQAAAALYEHMGFRQTAAGRNITHIRSKMQCSCRWTRIVVESSPRSFSQGGIHHGITNLTRRCDNADGTRDCGTATPIQHRIPGTWKTPTIA